eukprot:m.70463 g.70463  ORF g.70463 m.70463 type:complete len:466 (-) comp8310_c0_seq1:616-2013(-)
MMEEGRKKVREGGEGSAPSSKRTTPHTSHASTPTTTSSSFGSTTATTVSGAQSKKQQKKENKHQPQGDKKQGNKKQGDGNKQQQQQKQKQQQQQKKQKKGKNDQSSWKGPKRPEAMRRVDLFAHLKQSDHSVSLTGELKFSQKSIPEESIKLGLQMAEGNVSESTERCISMLQLLKEIVRRFFTVPEGKIAGHTLISFINPSVDFLHQCRPLAFSMRQALKKFKGSISEDMPPDCTTEGAAKFVSDFVDTFIENRIKRSQISIAKHANKKIKDNDVLLVFGASTLILNVLKYVHEVEKTNFRVIVIDSRPSFSGRRQLKQLAEMGISCKYSLISGLSYAIREATKVLLSASCMLSNGNVVGRVGTAMICMMACHHFIPVIVGCEAYKFSEIAIADSFSENELGDPQELVCEDSPLKDWMTIEDIKLLNLGRDVTPAKYVDAVATDFGLVPPTSSYAILRKAEESG